MSNSNEYMKVYMAERYEKRKAWALDQLGGVCIKCGSKDDLQFDHVDPSTKKFTIGRKIAGVSQVKLEEELKKCQLLCQACHTQKTIVDLGFNPAKGLHGSVSASRYCGPPRCEPCREANREAARKRRDKTS